MSRREAAPRYGAILLLFAAFTVIVGLVASPVVLTLMIIAGGAR
jgi:hypothetical protein